MDHKCYYIFVTRFLFCLGLKKTKIYIFQTIRKFNVKNLILKPVLKILNRKLRKNFLLIKDILKKKYIYIKLEEFKGNEVKFSDI